MNRADPWFMMARENDNGSLRAVQSPPDAMGMRR